MSNGIRGGRPPGPPTDIPRPTTPDETKEAQAPKGTPAPAAQESTDQGPVDRFERGSSTVGQQLETRLQALVSTKGAMASKIQFSSEDLQYLANTFAAIMQQFPNIGRKEKAQKFAKAILRRKKLKKVFGGMPDKEMEHMCDLIGDVLDSSPVFGQLVDNVADEAAKQNS